MTITNKQEMDLLHLYTEVDRFLDQNKDLDPRVKQYVYVAMTNLHWACAETEAIVGRAGWENRHER